MALKQGGWAGAMNKYSNPAPAKKNQEKKSGGGWAGALSKYEKDEERANAVNADAYRRSESYMTRQMPSYSREAIERENRGIIDDASTRYDPKAVLSDDDRNWLIDYYDKSLNNYNSGQDWLNSVANYQNALKYVTQYGGIDNLREQQKYQDWYNKTFASHNRGNTDIVPAVDIKDAYGNHYDYYGNLMQGGAEQLPADNIGEGTGRDGLVELSSPEKNARDALFNTALQMTLSERPGQRDARTMTDLQRAGATIGKTFTGTEKQWLGQQIAGIDALTSNLGGASTLTPKAQEEYWTPTREKTRQAAWDYTNAIADGTDDLRIQNTRKALEDAIADDWYLSDEYGGGWEEATAKTAEQLEQIASRIAQGDSSINADNILDYIQHGNLGEQVQKAFENDESLREYYSGLIQSGAEDLQYAKDVNHLGKFGDLMVDAASSTLSSAQSQLVSRIMLGGVIGKLSDLQNGIVSKLEAAGATKLVLGGTKFVGNRIQDILGMTSFGVGAYGGYTNEARQAMLDQGLEIGLEEAKNIRKYANRKTNIELATEMLFSSVGAIKNASGESIFPGFSDAFGDWFASFKGTARGSQILRTLGEKLGGGIEEGLEEVIGDALDDFLGTSKLIGDDKKTEFSDYVKDFTVGFMSGLMGEVTAPAYNAASRQKIGNDVLNGKTDVTYDQLYSIAQRMAEADQGEGSFMLPSISGALGTYSENTPLIEAYQQVQSNGKGATAKNAGLLYEAYQQVLENQERGEEAADKAITKAEAGKHLTKADLNRILQSDTAMESLADRIGLDTIPGETMSEKRSYLKSSLEALASATEALDQQEYDNSISTIRNAAEGKIQLPLADRVQIANETAPSMEGQQLLQNAAQQAQPTFSARDLGGLNMNRITTPNYRAGQKTSTASTLTQVRNTQNPVTEALKRFGVTSQDALEAATSAIIPGQDRAEFAAGWSTYYKQGLGGKQKNLSGNNILTAEQRVMAYNAGRLEYLANRSRNEREELRLYDSSERNDSAYSAGEPEGMAEVAGGNQAGQSGYQRPAYAVTGVRPGTVGARINSAGVSGQSMRESMAKAGYQIVEDANDADYAKAKAVADKYGFDIVAWRGQLANFDGEASRGICKVEYNNDGSVKKVTIFAQLDNLNATAEQIAIHEATHGRIATGEIVLGDLKVSRDRRGLATVRDKMIEDLGGEDNFYAALDAYADAYYAAGVIQKDKNGKYRTEDLQMIFEEMVCDAAAGMNALEERQHFGQKQKYAPAMSSAKGATENGNANGTRAGPNGIIQNGKRSLVLKYRNGRSEIISNPSAVTEQDALKYLLKAKQGEFDDYTYIPVKSNTSDTVVYSLNEAGVRVYDAPLIMQVRKARQAQREDNNGTGKRGHALSKEKIVEILSRLDTPTNIVFQTNRHDKRTGELLPDNVAVFVEYSEEKKEGLAVVEFDADIQGNLIEDDGENSFSVVVTLFAPDVERNGEEYDYLSELLASNDNYEIPIKYRASNDSDIGEKIPDADTKENSVQYNYRTERDNSQAENKRSLGKKSIDLTSDALGVDAYKDDAGKIHFEVNGREVKQITAEHVRDSSAIGVLIKEAVSNKFISEREAKKQYQAGADLMNMIMSTQDPELTWAFAGATMFSALKKNSDGQYGTTIDFTTVCRKTQEMVTAMSNAMKEAGRGLTKAEVTELQHRVLESGAEVPCPVCYVFSRWAGIGGMLNDIVKLQNKYAKFTREQIVARTNELKAEILKRGLGTKNKKGKTSVTGDGVTKLMKQLEAEAADAEAKIEWYEDGKKGAVTEAEYKRLKAELPAMQENIGILSEWTWASQIVTRSDYEAVPTEILFDLDAGEAFASKYPAVWKYRTTRGPSSGKAILPYSSMRSGDIIAGAEPSLATRSLFSDIITSKTNIKGQFTPAQNKVYQQALKRTAAQNLIGGQRYQSTSDFRYEYALDYIQSFWELQALGSKLQTYTKVVEYADIIAAVGGDVNLSVMPLRGGVENGKLIFSNKTGMNIDAALEANRKFDNAQLILVGINDAHILAALDDHHGTGGENIGFVIPYHASGASITDFISELVKNLGERFVNSNYRDYSAVQNDKERSDATAEQKTRAAIRKKILTGKKTSRNKLSEAELDLIRGKSVDISGRSFEDLRDVELRALSGDQAALREYLSWSAGVLQNLYDKMYTGAEKGTILNSSQAEHIMPHEYWNTDTTRANAYVNGFIFRSYAYSLGLKPRFSWTVGTGEEAHGDLSGSDGYWKTLIDRPMYNNDGTYREQQRINVTNFDNAMLTPKYAEQAYPSYKIQEPNRGRAAEVGTEYGNSLRGKLSRDLDSDGNQLTEKQAEYFKDSKVRDENGNLLVMYHGTRSYGFTKFRYGARGQASFFTPVLDVASAYAGGDFVQAPDEPMDFETLQEAFGSYDAELQQTDDGSYVVVDEDEENTFNDLKSAQAYLLDRYVSYDFNVSGIYPVYLNIKNPLVIYAEERSWNQIPDYNEVDRAYEYATLYSELDDDRYEIEYAEFGEDPTTKVFSWEELKKEFGPKYAQLLRNGDEIHDVFYDKNGQELKSTTDAWAAWAEQNGYDGVIFKNIYDGGDEASDVYVSFNPEQVKSIYNQNPTENPDIRFSRDLSTSDLYDANVQLKKDLSELRQLLKTRTAQKEYWKGQTKVTQGRQIRQEDVTRLAKDLLKSQNSSADTEAVAAKLKALGEYILNVTEEQADTFYDDVRMKSYEIAHDILNEAKVLQENGGEHFYKDLRDRLKSYKIYIAPSVRSDVSPDGWNALRSMAGGIFTPTADKSKGKTVDVVYHDLQAEFGDWLFPDDLITESEQLEQIFEVVETYRPIYENLDSYEMAEASEWMANEIMTRIVSNEIRETNPTYADKMEKKLADQKLKTQEALRKVREQRDRKVANLKEHYQEVAQARRDRKNDSEMRKRLLKIARRLKSKKVDRATRALLDQYIGDLDLVAISITGKTIRDLEGEQALYDKWVAQQKEELGEDFVPDSVEEEKLRRLTRKRIGDMTQEEVLELTEQLLSLQYLIDTQNKFIDSEVRRDNYAAATEFHDHYMHSKARSDAKFLRNFEADALSPERMMHRLADYNDNDPVYQLGKELSAGARKMLDYQRRANALFEKWLNNKKFIDSIAGKKAKLITVEAIVNGEKKKIQITPAMRMSLYLHAKNDQNLLHIERGGVMIPNMTDYKKGQMGNAYKEGFGTKAIFDRFMIHKITQEMSAEEKAFADMAYWYFNNMSKDAINEVSEQHKGYPIAEVLNYFPIHTSDDYRKADFGQMKQDGSVTGQGFLESRQKGAANPIMLYDMNEVLTRAIEGHSKYYGLAIPVRNMNKALNVIFLGQNGSIRNSMLEEHVKYIDNMLKHVQNGAPSSNGLFASLRSNYAGSVLTLNPAVAAKQTPSYLAAAAVIGAKPLRKALGVSNKKVDLDLVAKYTPLLWYRMRGYSNVELGDINKRGGVASKLTGVKQLNWIQGMDVFTTTKLWTAAEFYVKDTNKDLKPGTDAFYKEVGRIYNRIIEETQPNYTVMQRPGILRSDSELKRITNLFKTQPFQNFNVLYDSLGNLRAKARQYKASGTDESKQALQDARKTFARAVASQAASAIMFSVIQFFADAVFGKTKKYKDDEDEMTLWSVNRALLLNMLSSAFGMVPFGGTILEGIESLADRISTDLGGEAIFGQKFYGLSENSLEAINDFEKNLESLISDIIRTIKGTKSWESNTRNLVQDVSMLLQPTTGLPAPNIVKDLRAIVLNTGRVMSRANAGWNTPGGKIMAEYAALRVTTDPSKYKSDYYNVLYKAYRTDNDAYEEIRQNMLDAPGNPFATQDKTAEENIDKQMADRNKKYLEVQAFYEETYNAVTSSDIWNTASTDQKATTLKTLETIANNMDFKSKSGEAIQEKLDETGTSATAYLLYNMAISMVDQPEGVKGHGSYDEGEITKAIEMTNLSDKEKASLWNLSDANPIKNPYVPNEMRDAIQGSPLWEKATQEQRDSVMTKWYNLEAQNENGKTLREKLSAGKKVGLTETEYLLYSLALSMVDQPEGTKGHGGYDMDEITKALNMVSGLTKAEKSFLWTFSGKSEKNNPYK